MRVDPVIRAIAYASIGLAAVALAIPPGAAALLLPLAGYIVNVALLIAEARHGGVRRTVADVAFTLARPGSWVPALFVVTQTAPPSPLAMWWPFAVLALVLAADAVAYVVHRACHEVPVLWRIHEIHHRPAHVSVLTRAWGDPLDPVLWPVVPLAALALGVPVQVVAAAQLLTLTSAVQHCGAPLAEPRWPLLLTSHHHRHHEGGGRAVNLALWSSWPDWLGGTLR